MVLKTDNACVVKEETNAREEELNCALKGTSSVSASKKPLYYLAIKRIFDVVFSIVIIVIGCIPGLILAIAVSKSTKGSPIYSETRAGKDGKPFKIYKFRTMVADSNNLEKYLSSEQIDVWKRERKIENDPRITKLGVKLRASSADEFPQFVNVFLGHMSTIGPRAITFEELEWFAEDKDLLLSVKPGITGLWQTGLRNQATFKSGVRQELELSYVQNASLKTDIKIFFKTFKTLFIGNGQ